jgi:hypothetical protein
MKADHNRESYDSECMAHNEAQDTESLDDPNPDPYWLVGQEKARALLEAAEKEYHETWELLQDQLKASPPNKTSIRVLMNILRKHIDQPYVTGHDRALLCTLDDESHISPDISA